VSLSLHAKILNYGISPPPARLRVLQRERTPSGTRGAAPHRPQLSGATREGMRYSSTTRRSALPARPLRGRRCPRGGSGPQEGRGAPAPPAPEEASAPAPALLFTAAPLSPSQGAGEGNTIKGLNPARGLRRGSDAAARKSRTAKSRRSSAARRRLGTAARRPHRAVVALPRSTSAPRRRPARAAGSRAGAAILPAPARGWPSGSREERRAAGRGAPQPVPLPAAAGPGG